MPCWVNSIMDVAPPDDFLPLTLRMCAMVRLNAVPDAWNYYELLIGNRPAMAHGIQRRTLVRVRRTVVAYHDSR
jgi:hypothetical protein